MQQFDDEDQDYLTMKKGKRTGYHTRHLFRACPSKQAKKIKIEVKNRFGEIFIQEVELQKYLFFILIIPPLSLCEDRKGDLLEEIGEKQGAKKFLNDVLEVIKNNSLSDADPKDIQSVTERVEKM